MKRTKTLSTTGTNKFEWFRRRCKQNVNKLKWKICFSSWIFFIVFNLFYQRRTFIVYKFFHLFLTIFSSILSIARFIAHHFIVNALFMQTFWSYSNIGKLFSFRSLHFYSAISLRAISNMYIILANRDLPLNFHQFHFVFYLLWFFILLWLHSNQKFLLSFSFARKNEFLWIDLESINHKSLHLTWYK